MTNFRVDERTSTDELSQRIVAMAGRIAAATCRWLLLVAEFDDRNGAAGAGMAGTADWLSWACGLSKRTARDHVRTARALAAHPSLATEMQAGRLSYSHVRAISRVVRPDESHLVDDLVNIARHGTVAQLEETVRGLRTVRDDDNEPWQVEERISTSWTERSQWRLSARLDPEHGAVVEAALADGDKPVRGLRGEERAAVVVHIDVERGSAEPGRPRARVAGGPGLPEPVLRGSACASRVRTVVSQRRRHGRRRPLDVGRSSRLVTDKQWRALLLRDRCCAYPGCGSRRNLQAHHVVHWLDGGPTDMDNLVLLCERHHHRHHEGEFEIRHVGRETFVFLVGGRELTRPEPCRDRAPIESELADVADDAATTRWDGSRLDRDLTVAGLAAGFVPAA